MILTGWFYVNGVNKMGGSFTSLGNALQLTVTFESDGVEIVGYHNKLGDGWVPDFNVNNAKVVATAKPVLIAATGQLSLTFPSVTFTADITATGGCSPFGFDICNWITGSSGKVQNAVKGAVNSVLNADATRNAIAVSA